MVKVVFCLNGPDAVNGPNVWLTRHLPCLAQRQIEPIVLYLSWLPKRPCRYRAALEAAGIQVVPVPLGRYTEENVVAIAKATAALNAEAFVPNYSVAAYFAARFLREAGVVTVGTLHSDDPYYHDIIDVFVAGSEQWRLSAVVGVSDYLRTLVRRRASCQMPFLHAPYGAPVPAKRATWRQESFRLVYSGRLVERQKRVRRVARGMLAAAEVCERVEGVLFGEGPERSWLEAELAESGGRIRLGGLVTSEAMQSAMLEGQAFVLLSDFEGLSIALMEAMACGLVPIVTPMRSGVADLVEDGVTGLVVPEADPAAFAAAVNRLANEPGLWSRISKEARAAVVEGGYTVEACADAWARFLRELLSRRKPRRPLSIPAFDQWEMPARCDRADGIRLEDRRVAWSEIRSAVASQRPVFLWGASLAGEAFCDMVSGRNIALEGFVDSDSSKQGRVLRSLPIYGPEELARRWSGGRRPFVVITSQYEAEITTELDRMGMAAGRDFLPG